MYCGNTLYVLAFHIRSEAWYYIRLIHKILSFSAILVSKLNNFAIPMSEHFTYVDISTIPSLESKSNLPSGGSLTT